MTQTQTTLPKEIKTIKQFNEWIENNSIEVRMKNRGDYAENFSIKSNGKISYKLTDGVSKGCADINNFNRIFTFFIVQY